MEKFGDWLSQQENLRLRVDSGVVPQKWKATKPEIMQFWKSLQADKPIQVRPISYDHEGSTYGQDGVRITGSREFVSSVLARLKEFLTYETPNTKLQVVYRETDSQKPNPKGPIYPTFVFYIQVKERGKGGPTAPGGPMNAG